LEDLKLISQTFERHLNVVTASSGSEALVVLEEQQIDLLVTDQRMPGMSGIELVQAARARGIDIPTILVTAYTDPRDVIDAINKGEAYRFITKPWNPDDLLTSIRHALEMAQLRKDKEQLVRRLRKRIDALSVIYEVSRQGAADLPTYEAMIERVLEAISRVLRHECGAALVTLNENRSALLRIRCHGPVTDRGLLWVKETVLADYRRQSGFLLPEDCVVTRVTGTTEGGLAIPVSFPSQLSVSLVAGGHLMGRLSLFSREVNAYSAEDGELLDALANQTTDAIQSVRKAENEAKRRIELMVESMNDGVLLTDEKNEVAIVNPAARELLQLGSHAEALLPRRLQEMLGVDFFELAKAWEFGERTMVRRQIQLFDRAINCSYSPVLDTWSILRGMVIVLRDVTEEKRLDERKEEFVSIISHELRTPLTSISGALDLVLNVLGGSMNERQRRYLALAKDSADRLNGTVDDLLDLSKFAKGRLKMSFAQTGLDELIRAALDKYDAALTERRAQVFADLPAGALSLVADANRVGQVFNNLLTNAVKFMPEEGQIRIAARTVAATPGYVSVRFWNSGESIPEPDLERIFDKFEQVRSTRTQKMRGTGLGLAICRSIVESHGGRIWAEPCADGAQFVLVLPLQPPQEALDSSLAGRSPLGLLRRTILAVDQAWERASVIKAILLPEQHKIFVAPSAEAALGMIRDHPPDLIIIDSEEVPSVKAHRVLRAIPILPLEKPFRPEQLLSAVNQLLQSPIPPSSAPLADAQKPISPRPEPAVPPYSGFEDLREKAIERELQKRAANQRAFAFCCLDLHNLRAYNDHYGFAKTTGLIRQTGDLLHEIISKFGSDDDFLGHVPGDDFVFITAPESVDGVCYRTIAAFDRITPLYYDQPDRIRGYIEAKDRTGEQRQYPLLCASIVAVLCDGQSADHQQLARQATELKLRVKELKGSVYLRSDREQAIRSMSIA